MKHLSAQLVLYSQLALLVGIAICVVIEPSIAITTMQGGVSNYGTLNTTLWIFSIGVWMCAFLVLRASNYQQQRQLRFIFQSLAVGYMLLVLSTYPYKINNTFESIHLFIAFGFAIFQQFLAVWLAKLNSFDHVSMACLGWQLVSFAIGLLTVLEVANLLFTAQLLGGLSFGSLLVHTTRKATVD